MSKTRNERKRDKLAYAFMLLAIAFSIFVYFLTFVTDWGQPEEESIPVQEPEVSITIVQSTLPPSLKVINPEVSVAEPIIPDEVAQQEAQMPEFGYDYGYVCAVVAAECRGEPYAGQLAVAQCIRTTSERRLITPEDVVKMPNRYADPCTYAPDIELVRDACCDVFVHGVSATDEPIEYFYSTVGGYVSAWHENNLEFVMEIGNHRFFKEVDA